MARVREPIDVKGRKCWTLFDTGHSKYLRRARCGGTPGDVAIDQAVPFGPGRKGA